MRHASLVPRLLILLLAACSSIPGRAAEEKPRHWGRDRLVDLQHVRIELAVDLEKGRVEGNTQLTLAALNDGTREAQLDAVDFDIRRVSVVEEDVPHDYDGKTLTVTFVPPLAAGETRVVRVDYAATPRSGLHFVLPTPAYPAKQLQCWSQGEDEENRHWFPVHDYPNERATSETLITVKKPLSVVGNGVLLEVTDRGDGTRTYHHRMDFPHPAYLVSIAVADWAGRTDEWEGVQLTYHVPRARAADLDRTFANTKAILGILSAETGLKYPYPVYRQTCVTDFMWGGMENISATTLTEDTLHDARAHSDWQSDGLVAHEAAHQWFGDYVTAEDWSDIWLNEGFATYYGALSMGGLEGPDRLAVELDGMRQGAISADAPPNRRPIVSNKYDGPFELFDGHAYAKGGMVLHALRRELGDELYRKAIKAHLTEHAGQSVDTHAFVDVIERTTGHDVSLFFAQWVYGAGQPELEVRWSWKDGRVTVSVRQAQERSDLVGLFDVPLDLQVLGEGLAQDHDVRIAKEEETFTFDCAERPRAVVVDPQGWLLRKLVMKDRPEREALWVLANAPHLLSRLEAARDLKASAGQTSVTSGLAAVVASAPQWALRREAASALADARNGAARDALLACLAKETDSRVRAAAAGALKGFEGDMAVVDALEKALVADASYAVRAASARSLGKAGGARAAAALERALAQPSHRDEVAQGAFDGLADAKSPNLAALCERWMALGKPVRARNKAIQVWTKLATESAEKTFKDRVRERLLELLRDPLFWTRNTAAECLGTLEDPAAIDALRGLAASAPEGRIQRTAREAVRKIETAQAAHSKVEDLSRRLDDEKKAREKLEDRLKELESHLADLEHQEKREP